MNEVAELPPVFVDARWFGTLQGVAKDGGDAGVWGVGRHPRAIDVVVPQDSDGDITLTTEGCTEVLLVEFCGRVDAAGFGRRVFGDGLRYQGCTATRTRRIERTASTPRGA